MKKVVLTFGLICGVFNTGMVLATIPFMQARNHSTGDVLGYTTIVLSALLVFFGIRRHRENAGGHMTFGQGFAVGLLITIISCTIYVSTWQVVYFKLMPGLGETYEACMIDRARQSGGGPEEIAEAERFARQFRQWYDVPVYNVALTLAEPLPVGLLVTLISAVILRKKL